jgi:hypothetical protein
MAEPRFGPAGQCHHGQFNCTRCRSARMADWADERAEEIITWTQMDSTDERKAKVATALRRARAEALREAAQMAEDCIANGVVVLSAGEVADAIRNLDAAQADKEGG